MPGHPHHEGRRSSKDTSVFRECRLLGRVYWEENVGDLERHGISLEEVGEVDQPFTALGVGIRDELVVGQWQAEDV